jgi:chorismate mutase
MFVRGIRGAITVMKDEPELIVSAVRYLLETMLNCNPDLEIAMIASVIFTMTPDLCSVSPAKAAREMGWTKVPLICMQEIPVEGSLPSCVRILLHWNTDKLQSEIKHVYLGGAKVLRPDLLKG